MMIASTHIETNAIMVFGVNLLRLIYSSLFRISRSWPIPRIAIIKKRITPSMAPVPKLPREKALWKIKNSRVVVPNPGPPPVITKMRLKSAVNALIIVMMNEN